jgi:hypothetical protein
LFAFSLKKTSLSAWKTRIVLNIFENKIPTNQKKTEPAKLWTLTGSGPPVCQYSIIISKAEKIAFPNLALNA